MLILGAAAALGTAWYVLTRTASHSGSDVDGQVEASQTLNNVREAAKGIEEDAQRRADDLLKKSGE